MFARTLLAAVALLCVGSVLAAPKIEHWTLANGARVYFVETHDLPMVQLRAVFDAGSARDPADAAGLATLTARMLREGAGSLDADAIATRLENIGAELSSGAERDMATVDLRSLSDPKLLEPASGLYAEVLRQPSFPAEALERERARRLVAIARTQQNPGVMIEQAMFDDLYGQHPYGHDPLGTEASVRTLRREMLVSHHARYFVGRNSLLVIVGDLSSRQARILAERVLGGLPPGAATAALPPVPPSRTKSRHIAFQAQQSHLRIGMPALARLDPDYFPLYVGNYVLGGGGLVSRLSDEVREKRGLSYSVYSYFHPMREQGPFVLGLQTKNAQRAEALSLARKVLERFIAEGPSAQELEAAKKHLSGAFPLRIDSNQKIADNLAAIAFHGLPLNYLDTYIASIEAVTVEQIREAFRRHLDPKRLVTVTLGG